MTRVYVNVECKRMVSKSQSVTPRVISSHKVTYECKQLSVLSIQSHKLDIRYCSVILFCDTMKLHLFAESSQHCHVPRYECISIARARLPTDSRLSRLPASQHNTMNTGRHKHTHGCVDNTIGEDQRGGQRAIYTPHTLDPG